MRSIAIAEATRTVSQTEFKERVWALSAAIGIPYGEAEDRFRRFCDQWGWDVYRSFRLIVDGEAAFGL